MSNKIIQLNEGAIKLELKELVRNSVERNAQRNAGERSPGTNQCSTV